MVAGSVSGNNTDGHMMATSQILYGQYHIWIFFLDSYVLGLRYKVFLKKNQPNTQNHGQGTHSAVPRWVL